MFIISNCSFHFVLKSLMSMIPFSNSENSLDYKFLYFGYLILVFLNSWIFVPFSELYSFFILLSFSFFGWTPSLICGIHLPDGLPIFMLPIFFILELFTTLIRPFTLILRIFLNLTIGHMVLSLTIVSVSSSFMMIPLFLIEMTMAMLQAYVFFLLLRVYHTA